MAVHNYYLKIVNCRGNGQTDTTVTSSNKAALKAQTRPNLGTAWEYEYTSADVEEPVAQAAFLTALDAAKQLAPNQVNMTKIDGATGSLDNALTTSAVLANFGTASSGPWNERIGKQVFRYEIGISTSGAAAAKAAVVAHDLA